MKILIACEESAVVREAFKAKGHDAWSCDILPTAIPGNHYQCDIGDVLNMDWGMIIAFPPCTHLCVSGARWFPEKIKDGRQQQGIDFFMLFANANCDKIAIENPIGIMSSKYKKPTQIIQPFYFGDTERKTTCLWLKNLPKLKPTNIVEPIFSKSGLTKTHIGYGKGRNSSLRSKTFPETAKAMAEQWG